MRKCQKDVIWVWYVQCFENAIERVPHYALTLFLVSSKCNVWKFIYLGYGCRVLLLFVIIAILSFVDFHITSLIYLCYRYVFWWTGWQQVSSSFSPFGSCCLGHCWVRWQVTKTCPLKLLLSQYLIPLY